MKRLLVPPLLVFLTLTGCANTPTGATVQPPPILGANSAFAYQYEALAAVRTAAAQALTAGTLSLEKAQQVQALADQARTVLDAARALQSTGQAVAAQGQLQTFATMMTALSQILAPASALGAQQ